MHDLQRPARDVLRDRVAVKTFAYQAVRYRSMHNLRERLGYLPFIQFRR